MLKLHSPYWRLQNKVSIKTKLLLFLVFLGTLFNVFGQERSYEIDTTQSQIQFKISHLGAFKVKGSFGSYSGMLKLDNNKLVNVECSILVKSIQTNNEERDRIIREEAYLDVENFPEIQFQSSEISLANNSYEMVGTLKIKDVQNAISFPFTLTYDDVSKKVILMAKTQINRRDFQLVFGSMNGLIGNKINIELHIVAIAQ